MLARSSSGEGSGEIAISSRIAEVIPLGPQRAQSVHSVVSSASQLEVQVLREKFAAVREEQVSAVASRSTAEASAEVQQQRLLGGEALGGKAQCTTFEGEPPACA